MCFHFPTNFSVSQSSSTNSMYPTISSTENGLFSKARSYIATFLSINATLSFFLLSVSFSPSIHPAGPAVFPQSDASS